MMKKLKTILSLALVFTLIAAFMAGCSDSNDPEEDASAEATASDEAEATSSPLDADAEFDYETASKFLSNDELIMTVNGNDVYWQEYYYWLKSALEYVNSYYGPIDWAGEMESLINTGEMITMEEGVKELANNWARYYRTIEKYAAEVGVEITEEDKAGYEQSLLENYETEEALQEDMEANYITKDIVLYFNMVNDMYTKAFEINYGSNGSEIPDEDVAAYVEENGYYQAKHILFMKTDEEGNELTEEEIAAKKQQAEEVLAMLNDYSGEDKASYFQELADEYNEDTGASTYPDGYLYTSGTMVTEFEDAVSSLGDNEISGIVESDYGYHIIMRLPVNYNSSPVGDSYGYSLKYYVALEEFTGVLQEKVSEAEIEYAAVYDTIIPSKVFPVLEVEETTDSAETDSSETDSAAAETSAADTTE